MAGSEVLGRAGGEGVVDVEPYQGGSTGRMLVVLPLARPRSSGRQRLVQGEMQVLLVMR
jgi:hypothetical protein